MSLADGWAWEQEFGPSPKQPETNPYCVQRSPRGAVVVCRAHVVSEEIKEGEAEALARALNMEFETRMLKQ
jgi:hypothetical protein